MSTYTEIQPYLPAEMSTKLRADYHRWCNFLDNNIVFNHSTSEIHTRLHTARVLLYSLLLVSEIMPDNDKAKEIFAHASLFHDTCRFDDGLDVGHGARAAVHYKDFCERNGLSYHQEAALAMKYHDIVDKRGKVGIRKKNIRARCPLCLNYMTFLRISMPLTAFGSDPVVSTRNIFALRLR